MNTETYKEQTGFASELVNTSYQVGSALGLAIIVAIASSQTKTLENIGLPSIEALNDGFLCDHRQHNHSSQGNSLILGQFDSGIIQTGQTFRYTFNDPGTFEYYCTLHPSMIGKIVVS